MERRVSCHVLRLIVRKLADESGDAMPEIARELAISREQLGDPEATIDKLELDRRWDRALARSQDAAFGMAMARYLVAGSLGVVDYLIRSARTLDEAFGQLVRNQNLLQQNASRWTREGSSFEFELLPPVAEAARHVVEFAFASFVHVGRQIAGEPWRPRALSFSHPRGAAMQHYEDAFGVRPTFGAPENRITMHDATMKIPVSSADPHLATIVGQYADQRPALQPDGTVDEVRRAVHATLPRGDASLERVAEHLGVGHRTLRRRLSSEGANFSTLVDEVRYDLARDHLTRGRLSTGEIALVLGFSDVSAFYRAFRRWHGSSLSDYRSAQSPSR